jgi:hypothetical protein
VKNKNRHRLAGALLLDSNYFVEDAVNTPKEFMHHFIDEQENLHEGSVRCPRV